MVGGIVREAGRLVGPWERPRNVSSSGIHNDAVARSLGFRGAFVSGRVHLNTFVPLLLEAFGGRWFEQGTLSIEFRNGTLDGEEVRAVLGEPPAGAESAQVEARLERPDGTVVALGTASVGRLGGATWLGAKELGKYDQGPYELVAAVMPGDVFPRVEVTPSVEQGQRLNAGAVALPWYSEGSPWGAPIASPALMVTTLGAACSAYLREHRVSGVAIDGAIELRNVQGPVFVGRPYWVSGQVVARGKSPRTEYFWYEAALDDSAGRRVAEMLLQWRCARGPGT